MGKKSKLKLQDLSQKRCCEACRAYALKKKNIERLQCPKDISPQTVRKDSFHVFLVYTRLKKEINIPCWDSGTS